ncbi:Protein of unknown function (DUF2697) [Komagataella phaffii CBS 7435]|nr:Protein of unknown function (DUF2697) [Komagataella phaffii CBS 7435]
MRAPKSLEDILFEKLMQSVAFHRFVRSIHAKINGLPPPHVQDRMQYKMNHMNQYDYLFHPTSYQKFKAWSILFGQELRKTFRI